MKAAIKNHYWDSLGGGERYTFTFAKVLADNGFVVDIEWHDEEILAKLEDRFGLKADGINIVSDVKRGDGYDICFWVSDGSIPLLRARKNLLHFQFPFQDVGGKSLINKMKLFRIDKVICNSVFTKNFIDKEYGVDSVVVYPPVAVEKIKVKRKEKIILYVGRFSKLTQEKRQDVLIDAFKTFYKKGYKDWTLVLAGGVEVGYDDGFKFLEKASQKYPIRVVKSPSYYELLELYGKATFFWSASGYGVDVSKEPIKVEHFGITLVEAMAGGAVPLAFNEGGHREIIYDRKNGFLWKTKNELVTLTSKVIADKKLARAIILEAKKASLKYSLQSFAKNIQDILRA